MKMLLFGEREKRVGLAAVGLFSTLRQSLNRQSVDSLHISHYIHMFQICFACVFRPARLRRRGGTDECVCVSLENYRGINSQRSPAE